LTHSNTTARINTGCITTAGFVQTHGNRPSRVYYWKPGMDEVKTATLEYENNRVTKTSLWGSIISSYNEDEPKIYKVESITLAEDGMVEVGASYQPVLENGTLSVLDWADSNFEIEE